MSIIEDQPTPEEITAERKTYPRRYTNYDREYMREYMRAYRLTPEYKAKRADTAKKKREALQAEREALRLKHPKKYAALIAAEHAANEEARAKRREYMRQYNARPEAIERRKAAAAKRTPEQLERLKAKSRKRAKISRVAKSNGVDTKTVRNVLAKFTPPAEENAA